MLKMIAQLLKACCKSLLALVVLLIAASYFHVSTPLDSWTDSLSAVYSKLNASVPVPYEAVTPTPDIIVSKGYPLEIHDVTTEDGYILRLHRIPHGNRSDDDSDGMSPKKVIFLQHGIFATDFVWVTGPTTDALAYVLADQGYDVWLGNSRGNTYSRKHVTLDPDDLPYWDFSWDELGRYDIPASVDYILKRTQQKKLTYVGYSLGCALFFISAVDHPQLNDQIEMMIGLGPTSRVTQLHNIFRFIAPLDTPLQYLLRLFRVTVFLPIDGIAAKMLQLVAYSSRIGTILGQLINFSVFGFSETTNLSLVHVLMGHYPAGGSPKTVSQFFENYNAGGKFTRFNYGAEGNVEHYGTETAPEYNLKLVTAPVYLFYGVTDGVATPEDVSWLSSNLGNHQGSVQVGVNVFSHGDFFMSQNVSELLFKPLLKMLP